MIAATVISTGLQIKAQMDQARAQADAAKFRAAVARNNQIVARRAADDARRRGAIAADRQREATSQLIGKQRAALAGSGVKVDQDSALQLVVDTQGLGELDALTIRGNAEREAIGFEAQGIGFGNQAALQTSVAENVQAAVPGQVAGTLASGFGSVASKWYGFRKVGLL
jgi:hypothetical protein